MQSRVRNVVTISEHAISRREFAKKTLTAGAALAFGPVSGATARKADARPNILLIFSDQQHWRAMGFMVEDQGKAIWGKDRRVWEKYRDCYRTKTSLYDGNVGAVLSELKKQGLWDNTIIIATSDHGDMDANHKLIFKGPFMYEHMVRIPLMIRVPPRFGGTAARHVTNLDVVNVDIAPTIRDLCGLSPVDCDGISLSPLLTGSGTQKKREFVIGQYYSKQKWVNPIRMIRTHDFKFNRYIRYGDELYDLKKDPHELKNLAGDPKYADVRAELSRKLDRWIDENDDPFYSLHPTSRSGGPIV